jgi:two-component system phosphate regulon response regulator PhoB/two-component system alkaline phosphatase synthesis response regulator PhoP
LTQLIAVVDDEPDIVELVSINLSKAGFQVKGFGDADTFLRFLGKHRPALVILDLMLPDTDGLEICKYMKREHKWASIPIIMLTAKGEEADRIVGLELGADDYVTKPFSPRELTARVKAVLRRKAGIQDTGQITIGKILTIDTDRYEVIAGSKRIELTPTEFKILALLATRRGRVLTREQILDHLWGHEKSVVDRTVDVHIRNLRSKLGKAGRSIKNIRGVGYKIE